MQCSSSAVGGARTLYFVSPILQCHDCLSEVGVNLNPLYCLSEDCGKVSELSPVLNIDSKTAKKQCRDLSKSSNSAAFRISQKSHKKIENFSRQTSRLCHIFVLKYWWLLNHTIENHFLTLALPVSLGSCQSVRLFRFVTSSTRHRRRSAHVRERITWIGAHCRQVEEM